MNTSEQLIKKIVIIFFLKKAHKKNPGLSHILLLYYQPTASLIKNGWNFQTMM